MNDIDTPFELLAIDEMKLVLELQNRFELEWKQSVPPSIESFMEEVSGKDERVSQVALHQLILLELEYRLDRQEKPDIFEYLRRFPSHLYIVQICFSTLRRSIRSLEIVGQVAEGGLGAVEIAWDRSLKRKVAFKRLKTAHAEDEEKQARFRREALITARLRHPGIVSIYSLNEDTDGQVSYVMPLIEGEPLDVVIQRFHSESRKASPSSYASGMRVLLRFFVDTCQAIAYAHSQGCIHRDLKPQNVMVGPFGETVVVDWGLAKFLGEDEGCVEQVRIKPNLADNAHNTFSATRTGEVFGTPMYMSPEQAEGKVASVGPTSDVYSLGATLYNILTGTLPFKDSDPKQLLAEIIAGRFPKPSSVERRTPAALEAICLKCMAVDPNDRYATVEKLTQDVNNWIANEAVSAYSEPWFSKLVRTIRRHPTLSSICVVAFVLGSIGLALVAAMTAIKNQQLNTAITSANIESQRVDQMYQFFVGELSAASPIKSGSDRVADINQLMEHMIESAERFRDSSPVIYAKLLWSISGICMDRSEVRSSQVGYETLLSFIDDRPELIGMKNSAKLRLAECFIMQAKTRSKVDSLLAELRHEELDEKDRILFASVMGWSKFYQDEYEEAQECVDRYDRGISISLDRLQATIWSHTKNDSKACALLYDLIQKMPESRSKDSIMLYNTLADIHRRLQEFEQAEACSLKSIELADRYFVDHDQSRLMPRGQLLDVYYGSGRFNDALKMARQIDEIIRKAPDNASIRQMLPKLQLRLCIFSVGTPGLTQELAEEILDKLANLEAMQLQDKYEQLVIQFLMSSFLGREELRRECIEITSKIFEDLRMEDRLNPGQRNYSGFVSSITVVNSRLEKVAAVNGLSEQFSRFVAKVDPTAAQE